MRDWCRCQRLGKRSAAMTAMQIRSALRIATAMRTPAASFCRRGISIAAASAARRHAAALMPSGAATGARSALAPPRFPVTPSRSMFVQTEATPNADSIKFKPGVLVMPTGSTSTQEFTTARESMVSPLAAALFRIDGVKSVLFGSDFITVTKSPDTPWPLVKPDVFGAIMDFYASGDPLFRDNFESGPSDTQVLPGDSETVVMIKELLDTRIRPTIQEDGGDIEYCGFDNGVVRLKLRGACRTCDSSVVTLKNGIENMLMHYIPEVTAVEQVVDPEEAIAQKEFDKFEESINKQTDADSDPKKT